MDVPTKPSGATVVGTDTFWMSEGREETGVLRLTLVGELDIATAGELREHLGGLSANGHSVVLDLGRLDFIDSSGVRELIRAISRARRDGWCLTIDRAVRPQVLRVIDLLGIERLFWPAA